MAEYRAEERKILVQLARDSIKYGLQHQQPLPIEGGGYPEHLQQHRASFVTLEIGGKLRGCIGSLQAHQPLVVDIAHNAFAAAFRDPRFSPLNEEEFLQLEIHLSILSTPEPIEFSSEQDLIQKIRPEIDGLILTEKGYRGTFLPSVWEQLPTREAFLSHLKLKAGLPQNYWSATLRVERYTTESFA